MRPLYKGAAPTLAGGNAGLWYDKFCDTWNADWTMSGDGDDNPKQAWIRKVAHGDGVWQAGLLAESAARTQRLTEARRGVCGIFVTEGRFVTGLGRNHPVENGFAWHSTLGVPYLPGSSIKGLVRAWAKRDAEPSASEAELDRLLGRAAAPRSAGRVVFLDAIPIVPVRLEADVMTPHYAGWTPDAPPGDWRSPVPVPFLVVASQNAFLFSIVPRGIEQRELDTVLGWLRAALRGAGAGAKTAVGYGRFALDEPRTEAWKQRLAKERLAREQAARRAELARTPEGRLRLELETKSERELLELVRIRLEGPSPVDRGELRALARVVRQLDYMVSWRKGETKDKTIQTGRDKLKARARLVDTVAIEADGADGVPDEG